MSMSATAVTTVSTSSHAAVISSTSKSKRTTRKGSTKKVGIHAVSRCRTVVKRSASAQKAIVSKEVVVEVLEVIGEEDPETLSEVNPEEDLFQFGLPEWNDELKTIDVVQTPISLSTSTISLASEDGGLGWNGKVSSAQNRLVLLRPLVVKKTHKPRKATSPSSSTTTFITAPSFSDSVSTIATTAGSAASVLQCDPAPVEVVIQAAISYAHKATPKQHHKLQSLPAEEAIVHSDPAELSLPNSMARKQKEAEEILKSELRRQHRVQHGTPTPFNPATHFAFFAPPRRPSPISRRLETPEMDDEEIKIEPEIHLEAEVQVELRHYGFARRLRSLMYTSGLVSDWMPQYYQSKAAKAQEAKLKALRDVTLSRRHIAEQSALPTFSSRRL